MSKLAIVCGGRQYKDQTKVLEVLERIAPTFVIEGGAAGADALASLACRQLGIPYCTVPALWGNPVRLKAGYERNALMLKMLQRLGEGHETLVLAFPGGKGTQMMCDIAEKAGVRVEVIS